MPEKSNDSPINPFHLELVHDLVGCDWGRKVGTVESGTTRCPETAVQRVMLHEGGEPLAELKLCAEHRDFVFTQTVPRGDP